MSKLTDTDIYNLLKDNDYLVSAQKVKANKFDLVFPCRKIKPVAKKQKISLDFGKNFVKIHNPKFKSETPKIELANYAHRLYIKMLLYYGAHDRNYSSHLIACLDEKSEFVSMNDIFPASQDETELKMEIDLMDITNGFLEDEISLEEANVAAAQANVLAEFHTLLEGKNVL